MHLECRDLEAPSTLGSVDKVWVFSPWGSARLPGSLPEGWLGFASVTEISFFIFFPSRSTFTLSLPTCRLRCVEGSRG